MPYAIQLWEEIAPVYAQGTILLGNGASMAVAPSFNYRSLLEYAQQQRMIPDDVERLFQWFGTVDFELILRIVWQASNVNRSLQIPDARTHQAYINVRECLIRAVRGVHPEHDQVSARLASMYQFLKSFSTVFSLNYDLLVYWTMAYGFDIQDGHSFKDCFVNGTFDADWQRFREPYRGRESTLVFYPHGNLALCRNPLEEEFKLQSNGFALLDSILAEWESARVVPLFVCEGIRPKKIASIQSSYYLSTVYREVMASQQQTLTVLGWGLGEQDLHLLPRFARAGIRRVAVSVFQSNQTYCNHAFETIQQHLGQVQIDFFDSGSPGCWINAAPPRLAVPRFGAGGPLVP